MAIRASKIKTERFPSIVLSDQIVSKPIMVDVTFPAQLSKVEYVKALSQLLRHSSGAVYSAVLA